MFSDIARDSLSSLLASLKPDYAYPSVYPREVVINMIAGLLLTVAVSDAQAPDGSYFGGKTLDDLRQSANERAVKLYDEKMK
jgi:hypothetical protein